MVEAAAKQDLANASTIVNSVDEFVVPKMYIKMEYCVSCAIHSRIVRTRAKAERRNREPPQRYQPQRRERKQDPERRKW
jgi:small subunit ribosomal protein S26e